MKRKWIAALLCTATFTGLWGCSQKTGPVYVQNVGEIVGTGSIAMQDKFAGIVVSENLTEIPRDESRTIAKLAVEEGQDVTAGQLLFSYDSDEIQLTLDKQNLELESLNGQISTLKTQIADLEKDLKKASSSEAASLKIGLQDKQLALKQAEFDVKSKQNEIKQTKAALSNIQVTAPIDGRILSINENGSGGSSKAYITIQQAGSFRVKGSLNELNRDAITEGTPMRIISRTDTSQIWTGTVSSIDWENASQGSSAEPGIISSVPAFDGPVDSSVTGSSSYPFYVELDSMDGLILGQHVYMERSDSTGFTGSGALCLPEYYICFEQDGEQTTAFVWAESGRGKLEKRTVTLGNYLEALACYEITEGLTRDDYIAYPDDTCAPGVHTTRSQSDLTPDTDPAPTNNFIPTNPIDDGAASTVVPVLPADDPMDSHIVSTTPIETIGSSLPEEANQAGVAR